MVLLTLAPAVLQIAYLLAALLLAGGILTPVLTYKLSCAGVLRASRFLEAASPQLFARTVRQQRRAPTSEDGASEGDEAQARLDWGAQRLGPVLAAVCCGLQFSIGKPSAELASLACYASVLAIPAFLRFAAEQHRISLGASMVRERHSTAIESVRRKSFAAATELEEQVQWLEQELATLKKEAEIQEQQAESKAVEREKLFNKISKQHQLEMDKLKTQLQQAEDKLATMGKKSADERDRLNEQLAKRTKDSQVVIKQAEQQSNFLHDLSERNAELTEEVARLKAELRLRTAA